jgi:hypothetical protein
VLTDAVKIVRTDDEGRRGGRYCASVVAVRNTSLFERLVTLLTALAVVVLGTGLGLAAAGFDNSDKSSDAGIQLVRPLHISPEIDRARHDSANH